MCRHSLIDLFLFIAVSVVTGRPFETTGNLLWPLPGLPWRTFYLEALEKGSAPTSASGFLRTEQLAFQPSPVPKFPEAQHRTSLAELSLVLCFWNGKWLIPMRMLAFSVPYHWLALAVSSTTPGMVSSMCPREPYNWEHLVLAVLKLSWNSFTTLSPPHNKSHPLWSDNYCQYLTL